LKVHVKFSDVLPADIESLIKSLSIARSGEPIMSEESAVRANPLVADKEADIERLEQERNTVKPLAGSYDI
jgi:hypothetical protein